MTSTPSDSPSSETTRNLVVHCKKADHDIYIGRPSKWGNPYAIGKDGTREEVIAKYEDYLLNNPWLMKQLPDLKGKVLGCWCAPEPCHGDVLVRLANAQDRHAEMNAAIWAIEDDDDSDEEYVPLPPKKSLKDLIETALDEPMHDYDDEGKVIE